MDQLGFTALILQAKVDATQKKLVAARDDVRRSAVLLYRQSDDADMLSLLGSTEGSGQLVEGKHYLQRVSDKRQGDARRVTKLQDQLEAQQQDVAEQRAVADAARAAAAAEKDQLDQLAAQEQAARNAAASAERAENAALGAAISMHEQADAALQAESDRIAAQLQSVGDGPALGDGTFIRPTLRSDHQRIRLAHRPGHRRECVPRGDRLRIALRDTDQGRRHRCRSSAPAPAAGTAT